MPRAFVARCTVLVLGATLFTVSCKWFAGSPSLSGMIDPARPECPHDWTRLPAPQEKAPQPAIAVTNMTFPSGFSVPRLQTNVPEFNDCQKFILKNAAGGALTYGVALMAVFASDRLDSVVADPPLDSVFAAVEVLNYSTYFTYPKLGIKPYFNCLYLWGRPGRLRAKMFPVADDEAQCGKRYAPTDIPGQDLAVREVHVPNFNKPNEYPPVARWDWDAVNAVQYIGVRCGAAWCEVGPGEPENPGTPAFSSSASYVTPAGASKEDLVRGVKGWYDEQLLAVEESDEAMPSLLRGAVFPDTLLASLTSPMLDGQWRVVSHIALQRPEPGQLVKELKYYKDKFNLDPIASGSPLKEMNHVLLCYGTVSSCSVPAVASKAMKSSCGNSALGAATSTKRYWAQITSNVSSPMYRCMTPHTHAGIVDIPATARWRWLARDETSWRWCPLGCCEVNGDIF